MEKSVLCRPHPLAKITRNNLKQLECLFNSGKFIRIQSPFKMYLMLLAIIRFRIQENGGRGLQIRSNYRDSKCSLHGRAKVNCLENYYSPFAQPSTCVVIIFPVVACRQFKFSSKQVRILILKLNSNILGNFIYDKKFF